MAVNESSSEKKCLIMSLLSALFHRNPYKIDSIFFMHFKVRSTDARMFWHFPICYRIVSSSVSKSIEYTARWCSRVKYDSCKQREIIKLIL